MFGRNRNNNNRRRNNNNRQKGANAPQAAPAPPPVSVTLEDVGDGLKIFRVDKAGYLVAVPDEAIGKFYSGDSYVIFCSYEVSSLDAWLQKCDVQSKSRTSAS